MIEKIAEAFKTNVTPAHAMQFFAKSPDPTRTRSEHYMYLIAVSQACNDNADFLVRSNIVQYASADYVQSCLLK